MTSESEDFRTPGQLLEALLKARCWSQRILSIVLEMDETGVARLISGKRDIDAPLALVLEEVFEVPAERFLDLQRSFDLAKARIAARPNPKRATRAHLFGGLPVAEMISRGWISATNIRDPNVEYELVKFFKANRVEDIEFLPHSAKKTQVNVDVTPAQLAWLYRVKQISSETLVPRYSPELLRRALAKLSSLLFSAEEVRKVPRILAESGVVFVIVESLPAAKIDGVCFWLNENTPIIGLSMRYDRIDNFWFVLRHEIEHVLHRHGQTSISFDAELEGDNAGTGAGVPDEERIANEAASEFCVPKKSMDAFMARKAPFFYEHDILGFSKTLRIHPGLVAGQIRHRTGLYNRFANHLVKVRSIVLPNAIVDGWGNVAPVE